MKQRLNADLHRRGPILFRERRRRGMRERRYRTRSVEETLELGERIAAMLQPPLVVILRGEVGAGKTTLVKGIAAALGAAAEDEVTSPTFTIVHEYVGTSVRLFHLDLYRLETEEQVAVLGLDEMAGYPDSLVLVETSACVEDQRSGSLSRQN